MKKFRQFLQPHRKLLFTLFLIFGSVTTIFFISGCAAGAFLTDLESVIPIALTGVTGILSIIAGFDPALAPIVAIINPIVTKIEANLTVVKSLQEQYKSNANESTLANIESLITATTGDLNSLLTVDGVPPAEAAKIAALATAINQELQSVISTLPVLQASTAGQTLTVTKPSSAAVFKAKIAAVLPTS